MRRALVAASAVLLLVALTPLTQSGPSPDLPIICEPEGFEDDYVYHHSYYDAYVYSYVSGYCNEEGTGWDDVFHQYAHGIDYPPVHDSHNDRTYLRPPQQYGSCVGSKCAYTKKYVDFWTGIVWFNEAKGETFLVGA